LAINNLDEVAPTITSTATPSVNENVGAGHVVYTATADDSADISAGVFFSLKQVGDFGSFSIDAATGEVTLIDNPDAETKASYSFTVQAVDFANNISEKAV